MEHNMQEQMKVLNMVMHKLAAQEKRDKHLSEKVDKLIELHQELKEELQRGD